MEQLQIIKIGGHIIDDEEALFSFLKTFAQIKGKKILVHGGGKIATEVGNKLGIVSEYADGRRITDDDTLNLVTMVYGGLVNKNVVSHAQALGINAIGLTGVDAGLLPAVKRPVKVIDYGWAGDLDAADIPVPAWQLFLANGLVPVVAPLTMDKSGHILNTNADTIASRLSIALSAVYEVTLIFCFEKRGVLRDVDDESSLVKVLDKSIFYSLKQEKKISAGMLPKITNAFDTAGSGVSRVVIGKASELAALIGGRDGTTIKL